MLLEISIPTFNRYKELQETLLKLSPQLTRNVRIRVIDNASCQSVEGMVFEAMSDADIGDVVVHRNKTNVGLSANLIRCFELCESKWLFILGDDDLPSPSMVETLLKSIEQHGDAAQINFSSFLERENKKVAVGVDDFIDKLDSLPNLNFISTNLYKSSVFLPNIRLAYQFSYTMIPHTALTLSSLGEDGILIFHPEVSVIRPQISTEEHWSYLQFCLSQPLLLEIPSLGDCARRTLAQKMMASGKLLENNTMNLLFIASFSGKRAEATFLFDQIRVRWFYFDRSFVIKLKLYIYRSLFLLPKFSYSMIMAYLRIRKNTNKLKAYSTFQKRNNRL